MAAEEGVADRDLEIEVLKEIMRQAGPDALPRVEGLEQMAPGASSG